MSATALFKADDSRVRAQCGNITCHAQFLQVVESNKRDFWHNKGVSVKYVSNWPMISADEQLMGYDMRTVAGDFCWNDECSCFLTLALSLMRSRRVIIA